MYEVLKGMKRYCPKTRGSKVPFLLMDVPGKLSLFLDRPQKNTKLVEEVEILFLSSFIEFCATAA